MPDVETIHRRDDKKKKQLNLKMEKEERKTVNRD